MKMAETTPAITPRCRPNGLPKIDGRRREAKAMQTMRANLVAHVGGHPSAAQEALISRAVMLALRLSQLDAEVAAGRMLDDERFLAMSNSLSRTLARLGPAATPPPPSLAEITDRIIRNRPQADAAA
jgi:hypothetical protein